jgi:hypothetical protein
MEGRKLFAAQMVVIGAGNAIAQTGGWLLVRNAIDKGITPHDERHLTIIVVIYLGVAAAGWVLQARLIRGLATIGQAVVIGLRRSLFDHLTGLSLRYFSQQKAGWIIARLTSDVDAVADVLSQGMPTLVSNVILLPAAVAALLIADCDSGSSHSSSCHRRSSSRAGSNASRTPRTSSCATGSEPSPRRSRSRWPAWRSCRRSTANGASRPSSTR